MDIIAQFLDLDPMKPEDYKILEAEFYIIKSNSKKIIAGPMHPDVKKAISNTLMGHELSVETKEKISKTVALRNAEKLCGFGKGHAGIAGSIGGKSKSEKKIASTKLNQAKSLKTIKGSSWMIHIQTNKRKRVPQNMIEEYKTQGYVLGAKGK